MKEIVDKLLAAESDAQTAVGQAQKQAQEIRAHAETEYSEGVTRAREDARVMLGGKIGAAREEAAKKYQAALESANAGNAKMWEEKKNLVSAVTNEVATFIVTPEYERE